MSEETKMWEAVQCLPDAVEHLIHGDPDDADSVKASDAVRWAIAEIAQLREERKPVGWCVQAAAGSMVHAGSDSPVLSTVFVQCADEADARTLSTVFGHRVFAIVEPDAREDCDVPLQK